MVLAVFQHLQRQLEAPSLLPLHVPLVLPFLLLVHFILVVPLPLIPPLPLPLSLSLCSIAFLCVAVSGGILIAPVSVTVVGGGVTGTSRPLASLGRSCGCFGGGGGSYVAVELRGGVVLTLNIRLGCGVD